MKLGEKEKNSLTDFESIIQQHFYFPIGLEKSCKEVIARMKINMYRCTVLVLQHFLMTGGDTRLLKPGHMLGNCVSFVPFRNQGRVLWYC